MYTLVSIVIYIHTFMISYCSNINTIVIVITCFIYYALKAVTEIMNQAAGIKIIKCNSNSTSST